MKITIYCKTYLLFIENHISAWGFYANFILKIFSLIFLLFCPFSSYAAINENPQLHSQKLYEIKKSLKEKELEKNKLILKEKIFKKEMQILNDNIEQTEKKLEKCISDIKAAQFNLKKFSKSYNDASVKSADLNNAMITDIELFNKMTFAFSYEQNPIEYKIRRNCLEYKKEKFENEKKSADVSALNIKKWEKSKKDLLNLQHQESKLATEHKNMLQEKNKSLKTTLNKRLAAEKEIKALNDSAKALQDLINKINAAKKQKQTRPISIEAKRRKSFPWPVDGKVIFNFGKNKHPELDTYIISNGIKINAANFSEVKSINSGVVVFTGQFRSYGKVVIIDHKNEIFVVYGLLSRIFVKEGEKISKEKTIAELGGGKNSILYFEIRYKNVPDNPILWLKAK
ncbi:MAG: peptidoglycan DD-metalloendopeptidase family protein [Endomicrobium sp.]|jgi:septal ring factor EnvC (AmiA/AmiB activator)|nr:peptidoglycan DD-metalloendopeptidase family protein [Endomicrobium sp.]